MRDAIDSLAGGNKIAFLLVSILLLSVIYPFSELGTTAALMFAGLYLALLGSAIYLVSSDRRLLISAVLLTIAIAVTGGITIISDFTAPLWIQLSWNATVFLQLVLIVVLLVTFIIQSETVTREVLFAAIAIYFIVAAIFSLAYGTIEGIAPGAFVSSSGAEITWQRLTYFSLVTISTLGYGDIVPVASAAQSLSALEASIGTLYIAILIGRFVSLYQQDSATAKG
ncbi:MAG: potassium channel family protein [Chloroflexota bacterium]